MTWLALTDHTESRLSLRGLGTDKQDQPLLRDHPETLLHRGTLQFETHFAHGSDPQVLLSIRAGGDDPRSLTFQTVAGGSIALVHVQGRQITHGALPVRKAGDSDVVRVTYSWDTGAGTARLALERPGDTALSSVLVANPLPLSLADMRGLFLGQGGAQTFAECVVFAALSDQIEPVGPGATLSPSTPIATPWGYVRLGQLRRGDTVSTHDTGVVPVLHSLSRRVPARGSFRPIRLRAPYFGLQEDIIVSAEQRLLADGPEVEYLFDQDSVLVPARHLINGFSAAWEPAGPVIRYTQLLLPDHDTLQAAGTALESLYIGDLRRNPADLRASMLHHLERSGLPEHTYPAHPVLNWTEAIHLARQRAA